MSEKPSAQMQIMKQSIRNIVFLGVRLGVQIGFDYSEKNSLLKADLETYQQFRKQGND